MTSSASAETTIYQMIRWDAQGLVPAIIQDSASKNVLMLAYMSVESLKKTLDSGETWFWSRSRGELWHKGATSGHTQQVKAISYDCDADSLLVKVIPNGPACHTGKISCFFNPVALTSAISTTSAVKDEPTAALNAATALNAASSATAAISASADRFAILADLEAIIAQRDTDRPDGAYTTYLFEQGIDKILKKLGEEAAEVIIAAKNHNNDELRYEARDLIFYLMVLLRNEKLPLDDLMRELDRRHTK